MKWISPVIVAAALASPSTSSAQIYKWVDANGNVQFGNSPPQADAQQITTIISKPAATKDGKLTNSETNLDGSEINTENLPGAWSSSKSSEKSDWTFKAGGEFEGLMVDSIGKVVKTGTYKISGNKIIINTTNKIEDSFGKRTVPSSEEFKIISLSPDTLVIEIDASGFTTRPEPYTFKRK